MILHLRMCEGGCGFTGMYEEEDELTHISFVTSAAEAFKVCRERFPNTIGALEFTAELPLLVEYANCIEHIKDRHREDADSRKKVNDLLNKISYDAIFNTRNAEIVTSRDLQNFRHTRILIAIMKSLPRPVFNSGKSTHSMGRGDWWIRSSFLAGRSAHHFLLTELSHLDKFSFLERDELGWAIRRRLLFDMGLDGRPCKCNGQIDVSDPNKKIRITNKRLDAPHAFVCQLFAKPDTSKGHNGIQRCVEKFLVRSGVFNVKSTVVGSEGLGGKSIKAHFDANQLQSTGTNHAVDTVFEDILTGTVNAIDYTHVATSNESVISKYEESGDAATHGYHCKVMQYDKIIVKGSHLRKHFIFAAAENFGGIHKEFHNLLRFIAVRWAAKLGRAKAYEDYLVQMMRAQISIAIVKEQYKIYSGAIDYIENEGEILGANFNEFLHPSEIDVPSLANTKRARRESIATSPLEPTSLLSEMREGETTVLQTLLEESST